MSKLLAAVLFCIACLHNAPAAAQVGQTASLPGEGGSIVGTVTGAGGNRTSAWATIHWHTWVSIEGHQTPISANLGVWINSNGSGSSTYNDGESWWTFTCTAGVGCDTVSGESDGLGDGWSIERDWGDPSTMWSEVLGTGGLLHNIVPTFKNHF